MTRLFLTGLSLVAAAGCTEAAAERAAAPAVADEARIRVEVAVLDHSDARLALDLPGEVEAPRDAALASALGGYVERVAVHPGEDVNRGQTLVVIDSAIYAAQRDQAKARALLAESTLTRLKGLGDLATPAQLEQAQTELAVSQAGLRQANAQLSRAVVSAPFDGVVADVSVEPGEVAAPGSPVVRLVSLDPIHINLAVSDRDVVALRTGTTVSVRTPARASTRSGTIAYIAPAADLRTRAFEVLVEVPNADKSLLPGMIARVATSESLAAGIVIPQEWVISREDAHGVYVEDDGTAVWTELELGDVARDQVVVTSGLELGARVVITGHRSLLDGDAVLVAREGRCCTAGRPTF